MKQVFSMLTITVRSSFYKICLILTGMSMLQFGLFYYTYKKHDYSEMADTWGIPYGIPWTLESLIEESKAEVVFLAAFVLICITLAWAEGERKGVKSYYLYERLSVSKTQRFAAWAVYNFACMILLVFVQVLAVLVMGCIFNYLVPAEYESVQMYFMAFYKSEFLHSLIPMAEVWKWVRRVLLYTACSMEIAGYACLKRKPWGMLLLMAMFVFGFSQEIGSYGMEFLMICVSVICIVLNVYAVKVRVQEESVQMW